MEAIEKQAVLGDHILRLTWPDQQSKSFGVRINFEEKSQQPQEVKYTVRVTRLKPAANGDALFQIERTSEVYINETLPDLIADRLAYMAGKVFYPLVISVDKNGGFSNVANHEQILKRWEKTKANILDNFEGELVEHYVSRMEKQVAVRERVQMALLYNDWFLQTFFKPIYKPYEPNYSSESLFMFPLLKESGSSGYTTRESLNPSFNDFGAIELLHDGKIMPDEGDVIDALMPSGQYNGYYTLHPNNRQVIAIVADFSYDDQQVADVKVKIFRIPENGEAFDHDFMPGKAASTSNPQSGLVIVDGEPERSFWDRLFNL
jgi:hypothetical protein